MIVRDVIGALGTGSLLWAGEGRCGPAPRLPTYTRGVTSPLACWCGPRRHQVRQDEFAFTGVPGENFAAIDRALDERTIGHNPERLNLMKARMRARVGCMGGAWAAAPWLRVVRAWGVHGRRMGGALGGHERPHGAATGSHGGCMGVAWRAHGAAWRLVRCLGIAWGLHVGAAGSCACLEPLAPLHQQPLRLPPGRPPPW